MFNELVVRFTRPTILGDSSNQETLSTYCGVTIYSAKVSGYRRNPSIQSNILQLSFRNKRNKHREPKTGHTAVVAELIVNSILLASLNCLNFTNSSIMNNHSNCSTIPVKLDVFYWEQILTTVLMGIIAIAGFIGNSMIILAVVFSCKLQTSTNALVTSLACTDLLSSILLMFYMIGTLGKNGWPLPNAYWICQGTAFLGYAAIGTSIYTIAAIALNRLVLITKPFLYKKLFKSWKLVLFIAIPWIVPSFGIMICALSGMGDFGYDPGDLACAAIDTPCNTFALSLFITLIGFPIPLAVIVVSLRLDIRLFE